MGKLVLSRRPKERVFICVDHTVITVTVYETSSGSASLVFEAPPGVRILREELVECDLSGGRPDSVRTSSGKHEEEFRRALAGESGVREPGTIRTWYVGGFHLITDDIAAMPRGGDLGGVVSVRERPDPGAAGAILDLGRCGDH